jgi:Zn-dependent protease
MEHLPRRPLRWGRPLRWDRSSAWTQCAQLALVPLTGFGLLVQGGQDTNFVKIALIVGFVIISLGVHEAAHAWVALKCGDPTARDLGRITLNPIPHIDPVMTIIVPILMYVTVGFAFGGAKPVPVNYHQLRHPLRDMMFVAIAGPLSNVLLAILFMTAYKASIVYGGYESGQLLPTVMYASTVMNVALAVFNMLPIPPLDGSRVMAWLLPSSLREGYVALERFGLLLVLAFLYLLPGGRGWLWEGMSSVYTLLYSLTGGDWGA